MNTTRKNSWTEIEVTESDNSSDLDSLVMDLGESEPKPVYSPRKEVLTTNNQPKPEPNDDFDADVEVNTASKADEDLELRPKPNRAHKRIKNLLGERDQYAYLVREQQEVIKALSSRLKGTEKQNIEGQRAKWEGAVEATERRLELAMAENDPKAVAQATRELADAQMRFSAMKAVEEDFDETPDVPELPQIRNPGPPEAAQEWTQRNPWFFKDQKAHVLARTVSLELTNEGKYDPETDEYWDELDARLAKFNVKAAKRNGASANNAPSDEFEEGTPQVKPTKRKGSPIGSSRSGSDDDYDTQFTRNGNKVSATPTQNDIDMAERLGVDLNGYMKEKFKYSNQNYKGYVPIDIT